MRTRSIWCIFFRGSPSDHWIEQTCQNIVHWSAPWFCLLLDTFSASEMRIEDAFERYFRLTLQLKFSSLLIFSLQRPKKILLRLNRSYFRYFLVQILSIDKKCPQLYLSRISQQHGKKLIANNTALRRLVGTINLPRRRRPIEIWKILPMFMPNVV